MNEFNFSFEAGSLSFKNAQGVRQLIYVFLVYNPVPNKLLSLHFSKEKIESVERIKKALKLIKIIAPEIKENERFYINQKEYIFSSDIEFISKNKNYLSLVSNTSRTRGVFKLILALIHDQKPFVKVLKSSDIIVKFNTSSLSENLAVTKNQAVFFLLVDFNEEKSRHFKTFESVFYQRKKAVYFDYLTRLQKLQKEQKNLPVGKRNIPLMESLHYSFLFEETRFDKEKEKEKAKEKETEKEKDDGQH